MLVIDIVCNYYVKVDVTKPVIIPPNTDILK